MDAPEVPARRSDTGLGLDRRSVLRAAVLSVACLVVGALVFVVFTGVELEQDGGTMTSAVSILVALDALVGVTASIAVGWVRRSRLGNLLIVIAAVVSVWALPAWLVSTVRLGARRSPAIAAAVIVVTTGGAASYAAIRASAAGRVPTDLPLVAVVAAITTAAALLGGQARGTRAALVVALREQLASAEAAHRSALETREAQVARTLAEERTAIARDMHDGISHQLAIVAMHAGALAYRTDLSPEQQRSAARTVRDAASDASAMLRDALTTLRTQDDQRPTTPLPDGLTIDRLVDDARTEGQDVDLSWHGTDPADLAAVRQRAVTFSRILEELLLNARKYAPGVPVAVRLARADDVYTLQVENQLGESPQPTTPLGTGLGLIGVAERASSSAGAPASVRLPRGVSSWRCDSHDRGSPRSGARADRR